VDDSRVGASMAASASFTVGGAFTGRAARGDSLAGASSSSEFQAPQDGQRPIQRVVVSLHSEQR